MLKNNIPLNAGEKIVYKVSGLNHGLFGTYSDALIVTNMGVIHEQGMLQGMFDAVKKYKRYEYSSISQVIPGKARTGQPQIEIYVDNKVETFMGQVKDKSELNMLCTVINDQMDFDSEDRDYQYYQDLKQEKRLAELQKRARTEQSSGKGFAEEALTSFVKSGNYSIGGAAKAVAKATSKSAMFNGVLDSVLEQSGIRGVEDQFVEAGNQFRESLGLQAVMTNSEKRELQELEDQRQRQTAQQYRGCQSQAAIGGNSGAMSMNDQIAALKQLKELLDAGILTQDEFNQKKRQILGN